MGTRQLEVLESRPVNEEVISTRKYINLSEKERALIKSVEIAPPQLGSKGFGGILIRYKTPIYRVG